MTYCTSCGTPRESSSRFCTGCGEQVSSAPSTQPRARGRFAVILTALALVLGGGGVVTWTTLTHRTDAPASLSPQPTQPPAEVSIGRASDPPPEVNSGGTALDQLTRQISLDRPQVQRDLAETWVPQLSSKRLGLVANGITYGYTEILNDHVALRATYGARLVWSGDWSTFGRGDFYVTVAPVSFNTPAEANAWCDRQTIDSANCFAKRLSATAGTVGSTVSR